MSRRTKWSLIIGLVVVVGGGIFALTAAKRGGKETEVRLEPVGKRDLVATVTASGTIEPMTKVDVSADITGRIVRIAVKEGDWVEKGQFLIQIDPGLYEAAVKRGEALVASSQAALVQATANLDQAKRNWDRVEELSRTSTTLISTEQVEQSRTAWEVALANANSARAQVEQSRAGLAEARDQLGKTRLMAPMSGRVTRLNVEEGEVAVPGTFSRETALLLTISDLSVVLAKVQVDETDVVRLALGDSVRVTIDAFPDSTFTGRVSLVANSATLTATQTAGGSSDQAVDFDVEITLDNPPAAIRPGLSATARIITDTRKDVLSIPIIALTVRGHEAVPNESVKGAAAPAARDTSRPGAGKGKEAEGVFVVRGGIATFVPVKVGIAGEEHFEVLGGVQAGDTVVAGPYQVIRDLKDSTRVRQQEAPEGEAAEGGSR
ncbi:MAG TPA: efflux RND transporter periplasmic adaptor subunit [Gemmatimonadales bacterium]|nr:efflux RND transporter periplasmic adaptor subunit [Gemmatimonadales bacterium]